MSYARRHAKPHEAQCKIRAGGPGGTKFPKFPSFSRTAGGGDVPVARSIHRVVVRHIRSLLEEKHIVVGVLREASGNR